MATVTKLNSWLSMKCDGFVAVGHRGSASNEFETIVIPFTGNNDTLELHGKFNVITSTETGLKDALQIHELHQVVFNEEKKDGE